MLSPADLAIVGAFALIFFGPEKLPQVARKVGQVVREVQNTSQTFIREMERAADEAELREHVPSAEVDHVDVPHADVPHADVPDAEKAPHAETPLPESPPAPY